LNRLAIFDCDGTLVDSQHNICLAMEDSFSHAMLTPPPREAIRRIIGMNLSEAVQALAPDHHPDLHVTIGEAYKTAFHRLRGRGLIDEPLFDGIEAGIRRLEADGWMLGVATGKSDRGLQLCLDHHGITSCFMTLQTADRHPSKPHPSMIEQAMAETGAAPHTTVMIGDTRFDIGMAKAAGATAIGATWGYHSRDDLIDEGADHIVDTPADLFALLETL
jgi:phosphoglycolate phosphatase